MLLVLGVVLYTPAVMMFADKCSFFLLCHVHFGIIWTFYGCLYMDV